MTTKKEAEVLPAENSTAIAKLSTDTAMTVPDYLKDMGGDDAMRHLTQDDVLMPRIALAQKMSYELDPEHQRFVADLKLGDLFNSVTQQIYGAGPLDFVMLRADPPRWVEFIPREQGGGVKDPNVPAGDERTLWRTNSETGESIKPAATKFYDFIVWLPSTEEIVALSFKSTGIRTARMLNSLYTQRKIKYGNRPLCAGIYTVKSDNAENKHGKFKIYAVANNGWIGDAATFNKMKEMQDALATKIVTIDRDSVEHPDEAGDASFDTKGM